jgi:hypothetical protein
VFETPSKEDIMNTQDLFENQNSNPLRAAVIIGLIVVGMLVLGLFAGGCASVPSAENTPAVRWVQAAPVAVYVDPDIATGYRDAVDAAIRGVNRACGCGLLVLKSGYPVFDPYGFPEASIWVHDDGRFHPGKAQTDLRWTASGRIISADIRIPLEHTGDGDFFGQPLSAEEKLVAAAHELGHAVGLPHSQETTSVMYAKTAADRGFTTADVGRLRHLYAGVR